MLSLITAAALAAEPLSEEDPRIERAHTVSLIGEVGALAGPPVLALGFMAAGASAFGGNGGGVLVGLGLGFVGGVGSLAGIPMLAAVGMRMNHLLAENGIERSPTLGWVTWGLWGAGWAVSITGAFVPEQFGAYIGAAGFGLHVGATATGSVFRGQLRSAQRSGTAATWMLVPSKDGAMLAGRW